MNAENCLETGIEWFKEGEYDKALEEFERAIKAKSDYAEAWYYKGSTLHRLGEKAKSLGSLDKATENFKKALGALNKAIGILRSYESLEEDKKELCANIFFVKGTILESLKKHGKALFFLNKTLEINEKNFRALNTKGYVLYNLKRYEEARKVFNEVLEMLKSDTTLKEDEKKELYVALFGKGATLSSLGRYGKALKFLGKVLRKNPKHFTAWNYKGYDLFNLGRYKEALEAFNKIPENNPEYVNALYGKGITFFILGDFEKADEEIKNALDINEGNVPALILKGRIKIEKKEYESAIHSFKKAIHFDLGNLNPRLWSIYAEYLKLEFESDIEDREYKEGITAIIRKLEEINKLCENSIELKLHILYFLSYFYYKSGDFNTAKEKLKEIFRLKPKPPIEERASELLDYIWTYKIRPIWWRWWLSSPIYRKRRVMTFRIFLAFLALIFLLLFFHPFIYALLPCFQVNWSVYTTLIAFLILILLLPSIQSFKTAGFEVELLPPPSEPKLSPSVMIEAISSKKQKAGEKS